MKIKVDHVLVMMTTDRRPLQTKIGTEVKELTLSDVCVNALLNPDPEGVRVSGTEKLKRYKLAHRILDQEEVDLSVDEIVLIKTRIALGCDTLIAGQAYELLEPTTEKDKA